MALAGGVVTAFLGASAITQIGVNASLAKQIGHYLPASAVSFLGGTVLLAVINGWMWARASAAGSLPTKKEGRWAGFRVWELCGGFIGTCTLVASTALSPQLGFTLGATVSAAGSTLSSLLVDHFGLLDMPRRRISWQRLCGGLLVVVGCVGSSTAPQAAAAQASTPRGRLIVLALLYGLARAGQPVQTCLNRRLGDRLPLRSMAACVSFFAGSLGVVSCCAVLFARRPEAWTAVLHGFRPPPGSALPPMQWWMPLGGAFGEPLATPLLPLPEHLWRGEKGGSA